MQTNSLLGYALLGLIHQQPMSGYDLRKFFTTTAMGSFSDSPGAIYPALSRLETGGLARGVVEDSESLRKRRIFKITPKGLAAFKAWLKKPVTRENVMRGLDDLMLRFAFMEGVLGSDHALRFLRAFTVQLEEYIPTLEQYLGEQSGRMSLSARLALECGIQEYGVRLQWAQTSIAQFERRKRNKA